jgi:hydroxyacylglutathione hydrolase
MSFYVEDGDERVVFSGDILFVGDVGRPDLRDMHADPTEMASALYDTLHEVFWELPDDTVVYPAHGAGSLCGRKLGSAPSTTIGAEKVANWANGFKTRDEFVKAMVANLPDRPIFFYRSPFVNIEGARPVSAIPKPRPLGPADLRRETDSGAVVLDTRTAAEYGANHVAGSLNVGAASPVFSTWVGTFLEPETPVVLVVSHTEDAAKAWLDLVRIGYENIRGCVPADAKLWAAAELETAEIPQLEACCVLTWIREGRSLLDVRTPAEWERGGVGGAAWIPLTQLQKRLDEVPAGPLAVMCGSGYRSSIAASLLERAGRKDVVNVRGGWAAWSERDCPEPDAQDIVCRELFDRMPAAA